MPHSSSSQSDASSHSNASQLPFVKLLCVDIDGVLRGKVLSVEKVKDKDASIGFCSVIFGWDINDVTYGTGPMSRNGYSDIQAKIDWTSRKMIDGMPWLFLDFFSPTTETPLPICPRVQLKKAIASLAAIGYTPYCGVELEWFNYSESPKSLHAKEFRNLEHLTPANTGYSILRPSCNQLYFNAIRDLGIHESLEVEGIHTETGPGVLEVALKYCHALEAADRAALFKTRVKQIALSHNIIASFMAKQNENLPGNGGHLHFSLRNQSDKNAFYDATDEHKMSPLFKSFIAGLLHCLPSITPLFAPNINSYKRLHSTRFWAPVDVCWGIENRFASIRVINECESGMRCEVRVAGADANFHLAITACLAAGLYGITHNLILPPPAAAKQDNNVTSNCAKIPTNLYDATVKMAEKGSVARELFGNEFVDHFAATRFWECQLFASHVSDWELKRYLELI